MDIKNPLVYIPVGIGTYVASEQLLTKLKLIDGREEELLKITAAMAMATVLSGIVLGIIKKASTPLPAEAQGT